MTNNFRKFNARIGIVFVFQNRLIRLFTWRTPVHTLAFLAIYTLLCLQPYLLAILPLAIVVLFIMVPAFLARHPPPPPTSASLTIAYHAIDGPALAPARTIKPAAETSKDFFRNMRDLQNSMADFTAIYDLLVASVTPLTNFDDEALSSMVYLYLAIIIFSLFLVASFIPWSFAFLFAGLAATCAGHPAFQPYLAETVDKIMEQIKKAWQTLEAPPTHPPGNLFDRSLLRMLHSIKSRLGSLSAISLATEPQVREVEIFELQSRSSPWSSSSQWDHHLFTPSPYDPLSRPRISGTGPSGARFFEDVQPPCGWTWFGKKWELDLRACEWVSERLVTGVEFEIEAEGRTQGTELGGWVWDLPTKRTEQSLAYENQNTRLEDQSQSNMKSQTGKARLSGEPQAKDWEERTAWRGETGTWRRRRWVRLVCRTNAQSTDATKTK